MNPYTAPFSIDVLSFNALGVLVPELDFVHPSELSNRGPYVYVLVEPRGGIVYIGKSDAKTGADAHRALAYAKWEGEYLADIADEGRPDPIYDVVNGDYDLLEWSPIVRFAARHSLTVRTAHLAHTDQPSGRVWEARLQALAGTLTALESVVGGSGWEAKAGTLRAEGYLWARERLNSDHGAVDH